MCFNRQKFNKHHEAQLKENRTIGVLNPCWKSAKHPDKSANTVLRSVYWSVGPSLSYSGGGGHPHLSCFYVHHFPWSSTKMEEEWRRRTLNWSWTCQWNPCSCCDRGISSDERSDAQLSWSRFVQWAVTVLNGRWSRYPRHRGNSRKQRLLKLKSRSWGWNLHLHQHLCADQVYKTNNCAKADKTTNDLSLGQCVHVCVCLCQCVCVHLLVKYTAFKLFLFNFLA